jgi:hypothetical protein
MANCGGIPWTAKKVTVGQDGAVGYCGLPSAIQRAVRWATAGYDELQRANAKSSQL